MPIPYYIAMRLAIVWFVIGLCVTALFESRQLVLAQIPTRDTATAVAVHDVRINSLEAQAAMNRQRIESQNDRITRLEAAVETFQGLSRVAYSTLVGLVLLLIKEGLFLLGDYRRRNGHSNLNLSV